MTTLDIMRAALADLDQAAGYISSPWGAEHIANARKGLQTLIMDETAKQAAEQRARDIAATKNRPERPYSVTVNESEKI